VVFGSTEGQTVVQKPSEHSSTGNSEYYQPRYAAIKAAPVATFPSAVPATHHIPYPTKTPAQSVPTPMPHYAPYQQQSNPGPNPSYSSGPWSYQYGGQPVPAAMPPPGPPSHPAYYQKPGPTYGPGPYNYPQTQTNRGQSQSNLQWQPNYSGPHLNQPSPNQIQYYEYSPVQLQGPATAADMRTGGL